MLNNGFKLYFILMGAVDLYIMKFIVFQFLKIIYNSIIRK